MDDTIIPIHLRQDVTVLVQGVPRNLTKAEADKVAGVILALATAK